MSADELKVAETASEDGRELFVALYDELRREARALYRGWPPGQTVDPTGLVHEAYLALERHGTARFESRGHFRAVANLALRRLAVDRLRRRNRLKRGGDRRRQDFDGERFEGRVSESPAEALQFQDLLMRLRAEDARAAEILELRAFAGMTEEECAKELGISDRTVRRDVAFARAWMAREADRAPLAARASAAR